MKTTATLLLALTLVPLGASAQTLHISEDPHPDGRGCQNIETAYHADGDVVMVDFNSQWFVHDNGLQTQNGGQDGRGCELERIARVSPQGDVVWALDLGAQRGPHGIGRTDRVADLLALPNGNTVIATFRDARNEHMHTTITMIGPDGGTLWARTTRQAPKFAFPTLFAGDDALFVSYFVTNYGYDGGQFQLDGGKAHKLRNGERARFMSRISPADGSFVWERRSGDIVSADGGEVVTLDAEVVSKETVRVRYRIERRTYDAKLIATGRTPWMTHEVMKSVIRYGDQLVMTTARERVRDMRVKSRVGGIRVFDLDGKLRHSRELSDEPVIAERAPGAPIRILMPTNCVRGVAGQSCLTDALDVLTLDSPTAEGVYARITLPSGRLDNHHIRGFSTRHGIWMNGLSYYRRGPSDTAARPSVTVSFTPEDELKPCAPPRQFVWQPVPPSKHPRPAIEAF